MNISYVLIGLGLLAIIIELIVGVATGFDLFLIGLALIIGGGVGLVSTPTIGIFTAAVLCFAYVLVGRQFIKSKLHIDAIPTNSDNLIGKTAKVTKAITPGHPGQIKIEGETWRAESDRSLAVGDNVVVKSLSGVTLQV